MVSVDAGRDAILGEWCLKKFLRGADSRSAVPFSICSLQRIADIGAFAYLAYVPSFYNNVRELDNHVTVQGGDMVSTVC